MSDPSVSVVVELDNAQLTGVERARACLDALVGQIEALEPAGAGAEVVVVHDPAGALTAEQALAGTRLAGARRDLLRLVAAPGDDYYELKNRGAEAATGDVVVLVDSDVVPEDGWLAGLLAPFADPAVAVVAGSTYIEPGPTVLDRWYRINWRFPLRAPDGPVAPVTGYNANNVAYRRSVLLAHPFPKDGRQRGRCRDQAAALRADGIELLRNPSARTAHLAPPRRAFVVRAVAHGADREARLRSEGSPPLLGSLRAAGSDLVRGTLRTCRRRREIELGVLDLPPAVAYGWAWAALAGLGGVLQALVPGIIATRFRL